MKKFGKIWIAASLLLCYQVTLAQWAAKNSGTLRFFDKVFFPGSSVGYAIPFQGPLFKSTDGGGSWDSLSTLNTNSSFLYENSIFFISQDIGYVSTNNGSNAVLYNTTNGGLHWDDLSPSSSMPGVFKIQFLSSLTGYAYASNGSGDSVWVTFNGGTSWTNRSPGTSISNGMGSGVQLFFVNDSTGYIAGNDGSFAYRAVIYKTSDYGQSWAADTLPVNSIGHRLFFASADTGFFVSDMSGLFKTVNAGASWDTVSTLNMGAVTDIHFLNGMTGYLTTDQAIYKSSDGGKTWSQQYSGNKHLSDIYFNKNNEGYAVGDSGLILKLDDGLSAKKVPEFSIKIYPNPANERIMLELPQDFPSSALRITLFNSIGEILMISPAASYLDVSALSPGVYYFAVQTDEGLKISSGKLIIAR